MKDPRQACRRSLKLIYPQFIRKTVRRHKICVLLRCFDSMYARYMSFKASCMTQILCLLTLESSRKKNFFIFKADEESVLEAR